MVEEMTNDERINLIRQGLATEKYEEWAETGPKGVKMTLVNNGYCHDILIHDHHRPFGATSWPLTLAI